VTNCDFFGGSLIDELIVKLTQINMAHKFISRNELNYELLKKNIWREMKKERIKFE